MSNSELIKYINTFLKNNKSNKSFIAIPIEQLKSYVSNYNKTIVKKGDIVSFYNNHYGPVKLIIKRSVEFLNKYCVFIKNKQGYYYKSSFNILIHNSDGSTIPGRFIY